MLSLRKMHARRVYHVDQKALVILPKHWTSVPSIWYASYCKARLLLCLHEVRYLFQQRRWKRCLLCLRAEDERHETNGNS